MGPPDPLSLVLLTLRVNAIVTPLVTLSAPWSLAFPSLSDPPPFDPVMAEAKKHLPQLRGAMMCAATGTFKIKLSDGTLIELHEGDLAFLIRVKPLTVASDLNLAPVPVYSLIDPPAPGKRPGIRPHGGGGAITRLLAGPFFTEAGFSERFLDALPDAMVLRSDRTPAGAVARAAVGALTELDLSEAPGNIAVRAQLVQLLFVQAVREFVSGLEGNDRNWLRSLIDPEIGQAIALMNVRMSEHWTVADLAEEVTMSRSVFAARFTELVGVPPLQYLTELRMNRACSLLCDPLFSIKRIAQMVGYDSVAAFSNAFKRDRGSSPANWRQTSSDWRKPSPESQTSLSNSS